MITVIESVIVIFGVAFFLWAGIFIGRNYGSLEAFFVYWIGALINRIQPLYIIRPRPPEACPECDFKYISKTGNDIWRCQNCKAPFLPEDGQND
jgi:hypothetical protein